MRKLIISIIILLCTLALPSCALFHTCSFEVESASDEYLKNAATCRGAAEYYYSCSCGKAGDKTFSYGDLGDHDYSVESALKKYFVKEATMNSPATYYKSCKCGEAGTETFEYEGTLLVTKGELYMPRALTVTLYNVQGSVYGFTYNSEKAPMDPVIQIKKQGDDTWTDYTPKTEEYSSYSRDDQTITYYVTKAEIPLLPNTYYVYRICDRGVGIFTSEYVIETKNAQTKSFTFAHLSDSQAANPARPMQ